VAVLRGEQALLAVEQRLEVDEPGLLSRAAVSARPSWISRALLRSTETSAFSTSESAVSTVWR
jgi:hypothetical protein